MINVIIVDDQSIIREGIKYIIEQDPDINVLECAGNGEEALRLCDEYAPDLVLMDLVMPGCDGVDGTRLIKAKYSLIKIIILSTFNDTEKIIKALNNGADGYVLKDMNPEELILTIKSAVKGLNILHRNTFSNIIQQLNSNNRVSVIKKEELKINLAERELTIIQLIVAGYNDEEIAAKLFLSVGSIRNLVSGVLKKLKVKDRIQLAVFAVKNDLV